MRWSVPSCKFVDVKIWEVQLADWMAVLPFRGTTKMNAKDHKDECAVRASDVWGEAERAGTTQPGEQKARQDPISVWEHLLGRSKGNRTLLGGAWWKNKKQRGNKWNPGNSKLTSGKKKKKGKETTSALLRATCSSWSCLSERLRQDDIHGCLPASAMLQFWTETKGETGQHDQGSASIQKRATLLTPDI